MKNTVIYIHGQGGSAAEAEHYRPLWKDADVVGLAYRAATPWEAKAELPGLFDAACGKSGSVTLIANSIGAYFAMHSLSDRKIDKAFFISPVPDMEGLIAGMMTRAGVGEDELRRKGEIETSFGQTLSWAYLSYVREHPLSWTVPTHILYGGKDDLIPRETVRAFAHSIGATLTVMEDGGHWFHTGEEMTFLDRWIAGK